MKKFLIKFLLTLIFSFGNSPILNSSSSGEKAAVPLPNEDDIKQFWPCKEKQIAFLNNMHKASNEDIIGKIVEGVEVFCNNEKVMFEKILQRRNLEFKSKGIGYKYGDISVLLKSSSSVVKMRTELSDLRAELTKALEISLKKGEAGQLEFAKVYLDLTHIIYYQEFFLSYINKVQGYKTHHPYKGVSLKSSEYSIVQFRLELQSSLLKRLREHTNYMETEIWRDITNQDASSGAIIQTVPPHSSNILILCIPSCPSKQTSYMHRLREEYTQENCEILYDLLAKIKVIDGANNHNNSLGESADIFSSIIRNISKSRGHALEHKNVIEAGSKSETEDEINDQSSLVSTTNVSAKKKNRKKKKKQGQVVKALPEKNLFDIASSITANTPIAKFWSMVNYQDKFKNIAQLTREQVTSDIKVLADYYIRSKSSYYKYLLELSGRKNSIIDNDQELLLGIAIKDHNHIMNYTKMGELSTTLDYILSDSNVGLNENQLKGIFALLVEKIFYLELQVRLVHTLNIQELLQKSKKSDQELQENKTEYETENNNNKNWLYNCYSGLFEDSFQIKQVNIPLFEPLGGDKTADSYVSILNVELETTAKEKSDSIDRLWLLNIFSFLKREITRAGFPVQFSKDHEKRQIIVKPNVGKAESVAIDCKHIDAVIESVLPAIVTDATSKLVQNLEPLEERLNELQDSNHALRGYTAELKKETKALKVQVSKLESEKNRAEQAYNEKKIELDRFTGQFSKLSNEFNLLKIDYKQLNDKQTLLSNQIKDLENQKQVLLSQMTNLKQVQVEERKSKSIVEDKNNQLESEVVSLSKRIEENKINYEKSITAEKESHVLHIGELNAKLEEKNKTYIELESRNKDLEVEIEKLKNELEETVLAKSQASNEIEKLSIDLAKKNELVIKFEREIIELKEKKKKSVNQQHGNEKNAALSRNNSELALKWQQVYRTSQELQLALNKERYAMAQMQGSLQVYSGMISEKDQKIYSLQVQLMAEQQARVRAEALAQGASAQVSNSTVSFMGPYGVHYVSMQDLIALYLQTNSSQARTQHPNTSTSNNGAMQ